MVILAVFLLGIGVGLVVGVAVAVRGQKLDEEFLEDLDLRQRVRDEEL